MSVLQWAVLKHLLLLVDCLSVMLLVTQSVYFMDFIRRFPRTGVRKSRDCIAGTSLSATLKKNVSLLAFLLSWSGGRLSFASIWEAQL